MCSYHGIQDSSRKRRHVSQEPGAWAGTVVWVRGDEVLLLVSDDKWSKARAQIAELALLLREGDGLLPRGQLEEIRVHLVHISRTYQGIAPYLNKLHLTIDGWREDRDEEGWRKKCYTRPTWVTGAEFEQGSKESDYRGPAEVQAVPRLIRDVHALERLTSPGKPPLVLVRSTNASLFLYGFGDASGSGFGFASQFGGSNTIDFQFGQWTCSVVSETSSNYEQFTNFVDAIEELGLGWEAVWSCGLLWNSQYGYGQSIPQGLLIVQAS